LLGAYLGDGHCEWLAGILQKPAYQFSLSKIDRDLVEKVGKCVGVIFPHLQDRITIEPAKGNYHIVRCFSKELCHFLRSRCDIKRRLPVFSDTVLLKEFIAGLMDTDGWITQHYARRQKPYPWEGWVWQMGFATTSPWYDNVRQLLQHCGAVLGKHGKVHKPKDKEDVWADCSNVYINIASFVDAGLYFTVARKRERLQSWQDHVRGKSSETRSLAPACKPLAG